MEYKCINCNKFYSSYQSLWIHNKKYHKIDVSNIGQNVSKKNIFLLNRWKHENKVCKQKLNENNKIELLENKIKELENNIKNLPINNQLINIISDKNKKIEELKNQIKY